MSDAKVLFHGGLSGQEDTTGPGLMPSSRLIPADTLCCDFILELTYAVFCQLNIEPGTHDLGLDSLLLPLKLSWLKMRFSVLQNLFE